MIKNFKKKVLPNGFTILFEKREVPVVSVSISFKGGGINEELKEKGISHFIEHMLYKGTTNRTNLEIAQEIERRGGEFNGFTSEEMTSFYCKISSKYVNVALDVLGDVIKNPLFLEEDIEKERKVIFEEIKMRKDNPRNYVFDKIHSLLYSETLGLDLAGTEKTVNSITREDLVKRHKKYFTPNNLILTVVGNVNFEKIVDWSKKFFSEKNKSRIPNYKFQFQNKRKIEKRKGIDQANLIFAFHSPLANDEKTHAAEVLITLLAGGMSSRLFHEIREKRNLVYSIHGDIDSTKKYSHSMIYAGCKKENMQLVEKLILEEFRKVSKDLTEEELNHTKEQLIGNYQISMEDSQNQMLHLLIEEIDSDAKNFYLYENNISKVKLEDVKKLASKVVSGKYSFFALVPED
ncbi:insulinase family protein [archaeon]|nr:insulinase family protein [archaeon]